MVPQEDFEKSQRTPPQPMDERQVEALLGNLLRAGVLLSALLVLMGGGIYLARHGSSAPHYEAFRGEPADLCTVAGIVRRSLDLSGRGVIQLGLLLLIATPVARVLAAWVAFLSQRDWTYTLVATLVLAALAYSLVGQ
ncbi:MAG: DUF1634 domain-containing protein [Pirellulaceae bacterium]